MNSLGCFAYELEVGVEFSCDEGRSWQVVRNHPLYVSQDPNCNTLRFMASPEESPEPGAWKEILIDDVVRVLLDKNWKP